MQEQHQHQPLRQTARRPQNLFRRSTASLLPSQPVAPPPPAAAAAAAPSLATAAAAPPPPCGSSALARRRCPTPPAAPVRPMVGFSPAEASSTPVRPAGTPPPRFLSSSSCRRGNNRPRQPLAGVFSVAAAALADALSRFYHSVASASAPSLRDPAHPAFWKCVQTPAAAAAAGGGKFGASKGNAAGRRRTFHTASTHLRAADAGMFHTALKHLRTADAGVRGAGRREPSLRSRNSIGVAHNGCTAADLGASGSLSPPPWASAASDHLDQGSGRVSVGNYKIQQTPGPVQEASLSGGHHGTAAVGSVNFDTVLSYFHGDTSLPRTRRNYVFSHGATGVSKQRDSRAPVRENDKKYSSRGAGEDSYFTRHDAMGVADGVGGWSEVKGANPALYSRKLMHYALEELEKYDNIENEEFYEYYDVDPVRILRRSYDLTTRDAAVEGVVGSSTACIAILRDDELRIANLGDCGVTVIRQGNFVFRTEEQQHTCVAVVPMALLPQVVTAVIRTGRFNFPYQLGTGSRDAPEDAQGFTVKIQKGDVVVMGTDGIFDNLFDEDILEEVLYSSLLPPAPTGPCSPASAPGYGAFHGTPSQHVASAVVPVPNPLAHRPRLHSGLGAAILAPAPDGPRPAHQRAAAAAAAGGVESPPGRRGAAAAAAAAGRQGFVAINPQKVSEALARRAKTVAEDTSNISSPFQSKAMQEGLFYQ
ncbi:MAG: hypothetical protein BJ554DRAFT_6121, partial [Olpidium bornovanus]